MGFGDLLEGVDRSTRSTLGGTVTYAPSEGDPVDVDGIFDQAYVLVDAGHAGVSSSGPAVFLRLEDLPSDPSEDAEALVTVDAVQYRIREAQPDGLGGVVLLLHKV